MPAGLAARDTVQALYRDYKTAFPEVRDISPEELVALRERGPVVVVDTRTKEEQAVSMLPGAISKERFEADRETHRTATIVTYCTVGYRSGRYAEQLARAGYDVFNLAGSILAWTHAGLPLEDPRREPTRRVHVYGSDWNLAAEGYEAVW